MTTRNRERLRKQVWILGGAQALYFSVVSVDLTVTALAGLALAPDPALATLPLAAINITGALLSYVTGRLAGAYGYKPVLMVSAVVAILGGLISVAAISSGSFWLLCAGTALVGVYRAAGNFIRYWAAEYASIEAKPRALAVVMYGGLVAAFVGPLAAAFLADAFDPMYLGSFALVSALCLGALIVFGLVRVPQSEGEPELSSKPVSIPLRRVENQRGLWVGIVALAASGFMMTMVMAVGPLASHGAGHTTSFGGVIIQLHLIGMFAPSIVSAWVIRSIGAARTGMVGAAITALGAGTGWLSDGHSAMLLALFCSGVGWNLLFLAGTSIIVATYPSGRGTRIQAVAEGVASVVGVVAALSAALVYKLLGWSTVNIPVLTMALIVGGLLWWAGQSRDKKSP
jgi:MFS family permease